MQNLAAAAGGVGAGAVGGGGVAPGNMSGMDPDIRSVRLHMQEKILAIILQRQVDPILEQRRQRCKEIARRLEEGLFKIAQNKEEYENMNTLESRLSNLIKRASVNNTQRNLQLINSSSSVGTMIPTPDSEHSTDTIVAGFSLLSIVSDEEMVTHVDDVVMGTTTDACETHMDYTNGPAL